MAEGLTSAKPAAAPPARDRTTIVMTTAFVLLALLAPSWPPGTALEAFFERLLAAWHVVTAAVEEPPPPAGGTEPTDPEPTDPVPETGVPQQGGEKGPSIDPDGNRLGDTTEALADYLFDNKGEKVPFTFRPRAGGTGWAERTAPSFATDRSSIVRTLRACSSSHETWLRSALVKTPCSAR